MYTFFCPYMTDTENNRKFSPFQSMVAKENKVIGEELARLTEANKLLGDAVKQSAGSFECKVR